MQTKGTDEKWESEQAGEKDFIKILYSLKPLTKKYNLTTFEIIITSALINNILMYLN